MQKSQSPAPIANVTSLKKGLSITWKGLVIQTAPATAVVTNIPAPNNSPNTSCGLEFEMPANVEKISGAPLPNAKIVTPAMLSDSLYVETYCKIKIDRLLICYL